MCVSYTNRWVRMLNDSKRLKAKRRKGLKKRFQLELFDVDSETPEILKPQQFRSASKNFHFVMGNEKLTTVKGEKRLLRFSLL